MNRATSARDVKCRYGRHDREDLGSVSGRIADVVDRAAECVSPSIIRRMER
jgi:hypothetical protein